VLSKFATSLALRPAGSARFEGYCLEASPGRAFGGHLMALALRAACESAHRDRRVYAMHARFLRPVEPGTPVSFEVTDTTNSRSFSRRTIVGRQHGKTMIDLSASLCVPAAGPDYQCAMPDVPPPDSLAAERSEPIDVRHVEGSAVHRGTLRDPSCQRVWMRAASPLPDDPALHVAALAYMSDLTVIWLTLAVNGMDVANRHKSTATVEHSLWLHRSFRADDWLLYDQRCNTTAGGLGVSTGNLFSRGGSLVASTVQIGTLKNPVE